jgi:hypothetical protein
VKKVKESKENEKEMQTQASPDAGKNKKFSEETLQKVSPMLDQVKEILGEVLVILKED